MNLLAQQTDSLNKNIEEFSLDKYYNKEQIFEIDTLLNEFHNYNLNYRNSRSNSYLGNIGLASQTNLYFYEHEKRSFVFKNVYSDYVFDGTSKPYYYTERPFTLLQYVNAGTDQQFLDILHTQNASKYLNFGIHYRTYSTEGYYIRQKDKNKNLLGWIYFNKPHYSLYINYISNSIKLEHNGGIVDDSYVKDSIGIDDNIVVRLNDATSEMGSKNINLINEFHLTKGYTVNIDDTTKEKRFTKIISAGNYIFLEKSHKNYYDDVTSFSNRIIGDSIFNFYHNTYNFTNSFDTASYKGVRNIFFVNFHDSEKRKIKLGAHVLAGTNTGKYYFFNKDTLFNYSKDTITNDLFYGFGLYNYVGTKWNWDLNTKMYFGGYRDGDMEILGFAKRYFRKNSYQSVLSINASFIRKRSDYFLLHYHSNHFRWDNNFLSPEKTKINVNYKNERFKFQLAIHASFLDNYIYFDTTATPNQTTHTFDVYSAELIKTFKFWKFRFRNEFVYQYIETDTILSLPKYTYYGALYIDDHWFNWKWLPEEHHNVLHAQIGVEFMYNSSFLGYAFAPSIEQFYLQRDIHLGNYPFVSAFADFKVKNVRIFVKYENIDLREYYGNSFTAVHYPVGESQIRFGLAWSFYN